jgi:hypothetical protein
MTNLTQRLQNHAQINSYILLVLQAEFIQNIKTNCAKFEQNWIMNDLNKIRGILIESALNNWMKACPGGGALFEAPMRGFKMV